MNLDREDSALTALDDSLNELNVTLDSLNRFVLKSVCQFQNDHNTIYFCCPQFPFHFYFS